MARNKGLRDEEILAVLDNSVSDEEGDVSVTHLFESECVAAPRVVEHRKADNPYPITRPSPTPPAPSTSGLARARRATASSCHTLTPPLHADSVARPTTTTMISQLLSLDSNSDEVIIGLDETNGTLEVTVTPQ